MPLQNIQRNGLVYPGIYNYHQMDNAKKSEQLFSRDINEFITAQTKKLPFPEYQLNNPEVKYVYERRPYYYHSSFYVHQETNYFTKGALKVQHQRNNQALALGVATLVTVVASYFLGYYINEYKAIKEDIEEIQKFKDNTPQIHEHPHLNALHDIAKSKLKELDVAKAYNLAKLSITISALVSGIFLGLAALAAPELMAIGAIMTGLSLIAGTITWSLAKFDREPEKIANKVREQLDYLNEQTKPIPLQNYYVAPVKQYFDENARAPLGRFAPINQQFREDALAPDYGQFAPTPA